MQIGLDDRLVHLEVGIAHTQQTLDAHAGTDTVVEAMRIAQTNLAVGIHIEFLLAQVAFIIGIVVAFHTSHVAHE